MIEKFKKEVQETLKDKIYSQFEGEVDTEKYYKLRGEIYELQDTFCQYINSLKGININSENEIKELTYYVLSAIPVAIGELRNYTRSNYISIGSFIKILEEESVEK